MLDYVKIPWEAKKKKKPCPIDHQCTRAQLAMLPPLHRMHEDFWARIWPIIQAYMTKILCSSLWRISRWIIEEKLKNRWEKIGAKLIMLEAYIEEENFNQLKHIGKHQRINCIAY